MYIRIFYAHQELLDDSFEIKHMYIILYTCVLVSSVNCNMLLSFRTPFRRSILGKRLFFGERRRSWSPCGNSLSDTLFSGCSHSLCPTRNTQMDY